MSDKYYRGLRNSLNDVKYKLQLASMTLKINENKNNINGIKSNISGINNFSENINDNETNMSNNLEKINDNDDDIDEIKSNLNNIKNDLSDFKISYSIQNLFIYNIDVENTHNLNKDNPKFRSIYKISNDDIVLIERNIDHRNYSSFNNYLTIDEKFFYNFNEDIQNITFSIKFEVTDIYVIRLFHNKRNNNRLILKHFGN